MADQDGLRFLFDIQDKISAKLAKIEAKSKASAAKIDSAFTKASKAQQALSAKVIHSEKLRSIAVENATAKATAARTKETQQGKILAQRLSAAQSREARQVANFRIAAAKRVQMASEKSPTQDRGCLQTSLSGEYRYRAEVGIRARCIRGGAYGYCREAGRAWIGRGGNGERNRSCLWLNERGG